MADVISLKDGSVETLFELKDFQYLIEKYMGYDAETYFRSSIERLQSEADYTQVKVDNDLESYELQVESNTTAFQEILEIMEQIKSIVEAPRMNKIKMFKLIEQIQSEINNQI